MPPLIIKMKCEKCGQEIEEYKEYKHKGKTFRVYIWEIKSIKDFKYPKGFRMAEFQEFNELIESEKIELEVWKGYFVKHFNKLQLNKEYCLSRVCLDGDGGLNAGKDVLADSYDYGRVVCVK